MKLLIKQLIKIMFINDFIMKIRKYISIIMIKTINKILINISKYVRNVRKNVSIKNTHEKGRIRVDFNFLTNYITRSF